MYLPPVVARLTLDLEQFEADIELAKAMIDELSDKQVSIRLDVTGDTAVQMAAAAEALLQEQTDRANEALARQAAVEAEKAAMTAELDAMMERLADLEVRLQESSAAAGETLNEQSHALSENADWAKVLDEWLDVLEKDEDHLSESAAVAEAAMEKQAKTTRDKTEATAELDDALHDAGATEEWLAVMAAVATSALDEQERTVRKKTDTTADFISEAEYLRGVEEALALVAGEATEALAEQERKTRDKTGALTGMTAAATAAAAAEKDLADSADQSSAAAMPAWLETFLHGQVFTGGGWLGLGGTASLWGGLASIGNLHLLLDGLLETVIALGSALVDLGLGAAAAAPAAEDIATHLRSVYDVSEALHTTIPPLNGDFESLQHTVAPQVIEAYGGALQLMHNGLSNIDPIVIRVVDGFDSWIAKLDLFMGSQKSTNVILNDGLGFLHQFEQVADNLGVSFSNLVKADPGTAHYLMDVVVGVSKVFEAFASLPTPILETIIALHSFYIWGGLLVSLGGRIIGIFVTAFNRIGQALNFLLVENPVVGGLLAVGAAIGYVAYESHQLPSNASAFLNQINQALTNDNASQALGGINSYIKAVGQQLPVAISNAHAAMQKAEAQQNLLGNDLASVLPFNQPSPTTGAQAKGNGVERFFFGTEIDFWSWIQSKISQSQANNAVNAYKGEIVSLSKDQIQLFGTAGTIMKQNSLTFQQSLALMDMAGVQSGDNMQVALQKVDNLIKGYQALSIAGGMLENSANAVSFATEYQNTKVQQITQGYQAFLGLITGSESTFSSFEQQLTGIATAAGNAVNTVTVANGKVSVSTKQAASTAASAAVSITGLSTASLQLQDSFTSGITDAENVMNQLYDLASAATMGAEGEKLLTEGGKDLVAQLLPTAYGSQMATTEIYALAQMAGYQGADSFQKLAQWVGNVKNPAQQLNGVLTTLTVHAGNLATDVANLANAINPDMTQAMDAAIMQAGGGQKAFDSFATAFLGGKGSAQQMTTAAKEMATELIAVYGKTTNARNMFQAFASMLGITQSQAGKLWDDLISGGANAASKVTQDVNSIKAALDGIPRTIPVTVQLLTAGSSGIPAGVASPQYMQTHVSVNLDGKQIYTSVQKQAVNTQRRTGSNGLTKRFK